MSDAPEASPVPKSKRTLSALRLLPQLVKPHAALVAGWIGFLVLSSAATLSLPVAVRLMIDRGFGADDPAAIDRWFVGLFVVAAVLAIATATRFYFASLLGERVVSDLKRRLYDHLLLLHMGFFERSRSGELVSRLSADTEQIRSMVGSSASVALRSVVTLLGSGAMLVITSPRLAGLAAIGIPLVVLPIVIYGRRVQGIARESQDRVADANARAAETLGAMHTVQSFARERWESSRFATAIDLALDAARRRIRTQAWLTATVILLVFGAITAVLWLGAKDVVSGSLSAGTLGQFVLYAVLGAGSVGALSEVWAEVQRAAGGMERLQDLLETPTEIHSPESPLALPAAVRGELRFESVNFAYPSRLETPALVDFNLLLKPGETVALVGPSGAGKSTVLQLVARFYDPQSGRISLDGIDLKDLAPDELRSQLALVPQSPVIFAGDVEENIRYGRLDATRDDIVDAARSAEADDFISAMPEGYATWLGERGVRLSGGQQQRIAIARAVLKRAPVLLLDEATSALDAASERAIQQALDRLVVGRTTLVIAHRLATVRRADRIIVLDGGRIVAQGRHDELMAAGGLYADLAKLQFLSE